MPRQKPLPESLAAALRPGGKRSIEEIFYGSKKIVCTSDGLRYRLRICSWVTKPVEVLLSSRNPAALDFAQQLIEVEEGLRPLPGKEGDWITLAGRFFLRFVASSFTSGRPAEELALAALVLEEILPQDKLAIQARLIPLERLAGNSRLSVETQRRARLILESRRAALLKPMVIEDRNPEPERQVRGVTLMRAAMMMAERDDEVARQLVRKWHNTRTHRLPKPIGKKNGREDLYKPSALCNYFESIGALMPGGKSSFLKALKLCWDVAIPNKPLP